MTTEQAARTIQDFLARYGRASLKLPSGWFGRPYDNLHQLTAVDAQDEFRLTVKLDGSLHLTLRGPTSVTVDGPVLRLSGFEHAAWHWRDCGSGVQHDEEFEGGEVELAAHV